MQHHYATPLCNTATTLPFSVPCPLPPTLSLQDVQEVLGDLPSGCSLAEEIVRTFEQILDETVFAKRVF